MLKPCAWLIAGLALAWCAGCGSKPGPDGGSGKKPPKKLRIAVVPKGTTHTFWKAIHAGALKAGEELGVEIIWKGPLREDSKEEQIKIVEDLITAKVDGLVLAPLDFLALRQPVAEAGRAGIPVVIIDSSLDGKDYVSYVATDNYQGGKLGGQRLAALLKGQGKIILLRYQKGSASTDQREAGFLDAIKAHPGIQIVSENQEGGATRESAQKTAESLLVNFTQNDALTVDGIFCPNESTTFGMLRALQLAKQAGKGKFVGFDSEETLIQALGKDELHGLVLQNPYRMGYTGVKTVAAHLRGGKTDSVIDTGAAVATKENMNQPEMKELLNPPRAE